MRLPDGPSFQAQDIPAAIGLLSRLPVRVNPQSAADRGAHGAWAYPVAGALIGAIAGLAGLIALSLGLSFGIAAALALAFMVITTGALHEDGLADSFDGLWGGHTADRRLEIMADSRIGTYGVLALVLTSLLRWVALDELFSAGYVFWTLIGVAALSRAPMVVMMQSLEPARAGGLSAGQGRPGENAVWGALGVAAILGVLCLGGTVFVAAIILTIASYGLSRIADAKIGGQTGDILGASQQICEVAILLTLVASL